MDGIPLRPTLVILALLAGACTTGQRTGGATPAAPNAGLAAIDAIVVPVVPTRRHRYDEAYWLNLQNCLYDRAGCDPAQLDAMDQRRVLSS